MKDKSKAAFPLMTEQSQNPDGTWNQTTDWQHGMTLREWYAGLAMQGLVQKDGIHALYKIHEEAVKQADALIEELEKEAK